VDEFLELVLELGLGVVDEAIAGKKIGTYDAQLVYRLGLLGGGFIGDYFAPRDLKPVIKPFKAAGAVLTGKTLGAYIMAKTYTRVYTAPATATVPAVVPPATRHAGSLSSY
jgi:hypothetical protein